MRTLLRLVAILGLATGAVAVVAGVAAAALLGRDDTVEIVETTVASDGVAVVSTPGLLAVYGPTLRVRAASPDPVLVGVARDVDLFDYLREAQRTEITSFAWPDSVGLNQLDGERRVPAPAGRDFWVASQEGSGTVNVAWPMTDGRHGLALLRPDGRAGLQAEVSIGLTFAGAFVAALGLAVAGAVMVAGSIVLLRRTRRRPPTPVSEPAAPAPSRPSVEVR